MIGYLTRHPLQKNREQALSKRWFAAVFLLLLTLLALVVWRNFFLQTHRIVAHVKVNSLLPALKVFDGKGHMVDLSVQGYGHRRVIAFYAVDCHVCQETLPELHPFPKNLTLQMVSERDLSRIPEQNLPTLPDQLYFDRDDILSAAVPLASLPTILFVDEKDVVRDASVGLRDRDSLQAKLHAFQNLGASQ